MPPPPPALTFTAADADTNTVNAGTGATSQALAQIADEIRVEAWELALAVVEEGLRDDTIPPLARLGRIGQVADMPTFIAELAQQLLHPEPNRLRRGSALAALVRDHAREREALGFAPRDIVTEFLVLRRVLWKLVQERSAGLEAGDVLVLEQRLNDTIDKLVTECVVAYFDRATSELAYKARHDPLTDLLNHSVFTRELELELERAERYGHGVTLVFIDFDRFKQINDTYGHREGDRALRRIAQLLQTELRRSDLAGRMGGDEFATCLVESDEDTGVNFLERLHARIDELIASGELAVPLAVSAGVAQYPTEARDVDSLFGLADERLYESKRAKAA
jgi:diguanylate cyclase (GGDEF)-like protein